MSDDYDELAAVGALLDTNIGDLMNELLATRELCQAMLDAQAAASSFARAVMKDAGEGALDMLDSNVEAKGRHVLTTLDTFAARYPGRLRI